MIDQQQQTAPSPGGQHRDPAQGIDGIYQRILLEQVAIGQISQALHNCVDQLKAALPPSARMEHALNGIYSAIDGLSPVWTHQKHQELTSRANFEVFRHLTAKLWLRENDPANATNAKAAGLTSRARAYARNDFGGNPHWQDGVIELIKGRRVVTYINCRLLHLVHKFGWTVKNAKIAEAQMDLLEFGALCGPVAMPTLLPRSAKPRKVRRER